MQNKNERNEVFIFITERSLSYFTQLGIKRSPLNCIKKYKMLL